MLSATSPGEVMAAQSAINRVLNGHGADLHVLSGAVEQVMSMPVAIAVEAIPPWRNGANWLACTHWSAKSDMLSDWESNFLDSLSQCWNRPTTRQLACLSRIYTKLRGGA